MGRIRELSSAELSSLSRQLALVVDSELSLQEGLELLRQQSKPRPVQELLRRARNRVNEGQSLSEAFAEEKELLPEFYIQMIRMGEQSGNLVRVLSRVADSYDKEAKISSKVMSAVTYPLILTVLMLCVIILLLTEVLPMFDEVLSSLGGEMPGITRALMDIGAFVSSYFYVLLLIIAVVIIVVVVMRQSERGRERLDAMKLRMPVRGRITRNICAVRFARNLAMLLRSGIGVAASVRMTRSIVMNAHIASLVGEAAERVESGETLRSALLPLGLFPDLLVRLLSVAESTGHTDDMLDRAADVLEEELDERLAKLTTVLEPALIIVLSIIIGVVLVSVILPVARIMNTVG
jgi:type IV pilus assembly protein PilC